MSKLLSLTWDPPSTLFTIPHFNLEVRIYGLLFALGFLAGYYLMDRSLAGYLRSKHDPEPRAKSKLLTDRLTTFSIIGCIIGARLGHVLFYDTDYYYAYPIKMFAIWEGGLASHGGAVGVLLAFYLYWKKYAKEMYEITFLNLFDLFVVPVAFVAFFIRLGNFFNQEILGTATNMPWGLIFPHAIDGGNDFARHPVQLYEGLFYLATFISLYILNKKPRKEGMISGLFFVLVFSSRFLFEFLKSPQGGTFDDLSLQTGQILSIPFIAYGFYLIFKKPTRSKLEKVT